MLIKAEQKKSTLWMAKMLFTIAVIYAGLLVLLYLTQTWLLFPTWLMSKGPLALPDSAKRLEIESSDGDRLAGVLLPAAESAEGTPPLILAFGGNAWNAVDLALYLRENYSQADIVAFHYRGYRPSTGRPSAAALLADGLLIYDHIRLTRDPDRIIAVGLSLGAGVAAHLAAHRPLQGMIMVTPFDSLLKLAQQHYFWVPVRLLLRHRMPVADSMRKTAVPTAIIAAEHDTIVPPARTEALRQAVPHLVFDQTIRGAGHNDIYARPDFTAAMHEALRRIGTGIHQ